MKLSKKKLSTSLDNLFESHMSTLVEYDTNKKPDKETFEIINKTPQEKTLDHSDVADYKNIKKAILNHLHKKYVENLKLLMRDYDIPNEIKKQWKRDLIVPLSDISKTQDKKYAKEIAALYAIFKKYITVKTDINTKETTKAEQEFPLGTIKMMISRGDNLSKIAQHFNVPNSTMSHKLKTLYQTSFSTLKKQMNK